MQKEYIVTYRPRGYRWARESAIVVYAESKKEARVEALMRVGDENSIVSAKEVRR